MKKLSAVVLALALLLAPAALAADVTTLFPVTRAAITFPDVPAGTWYESAVTLCYETGLLNGTDVGFSPAGTVTVAEAAMLAARIHDILSGGDGHTLEADTEELWYAFGLARMKNLDAGIAALDFPERDATRNDFFAMLDTVLTDDLLAPINSITALPDTDDTAVLAFYNAGILTGTDTYGTFSGGRTLTRAEMAAMAARLVRPSLRVAFTPKTKPVITDDTIFFTLNGQAFKTAQFIAELEESFASVGMILDWTQDYGVGDLNEYFRESALYLAQVKAAILQFAAANNLPTGDIDAAYEAAVELLYATPLRAKHILLKTIDDNNQPLSPEEQAGALQKAEIFLEVLQANPTEAQFDELMNEHGEDPGMAYYPNGYVFGIGQMVPAFESAVLGLPIGGISGIVESDFGYHIILRLDPEDDPAELDAHLQDYAGTVYDAFGTVLRAIMETYRCTTTEAFDNFDCGAHYAIWLAGG